MKRAYFLVAFFLLLVGCATSVNKSVETITERIHQIKIGMSMDEVTALIGKPATITRQSMTAEGTFQTWVYDENQLMLNLGTKGAAMSYAFGRGLSNGKSEMMGLDFKNGRLTKLGMY